MLSTKENIRAILECNFAGFKDEYIEIALDRIMEIIDDANDIQYAYDQGFKSGYELGKEERPHGEREFIEILAQNVPEDLCTYPEYKGKPYYSIHYKENGEDFVGFGTYNPEVLSRYLRDYFMRGDADNDNK